MANVKERMKKKTNSRATHIANSIISGAIENKSFLVCA